MRRDEAGGVITGWFFQVLVFLAVLSFVAYELISVGVTAVNLDDDARDVAKVAGAAYRDERTRRAERAREAAEEEAADREVELTSFTIEDGSVVVEVTEQAPTVLLHRIGPLEDFTRPSATGRGRTR